VQSQEVLQDILTAFDGTILFISHDRYLIDALATHVWYVREGRLYQYEGNYTDFVRARQAEMAQAGGDKVQQTPRHETNDRAAQRRERRILALEQEIAEIEARLDEMPMLINQASERQDIAQVAALGSEYESLTADLHLRMGEWERVASDHVQ